MSPKHVSPRRLLPQQHRLRQHSASEPLARAPLYSQHLPATAIHTLPPIEEAMRSAARQDLHSSPFISNRTATASAPGVTATTATTASGTNTVVTSAAPPATGTAPAAHQPSMILGFTAASPPLLVPSANSTAPLPPFATTPTGLAMPSSQPAAASASTLPGGATTAASRAVGGSAVGGSAVGGSAVGGSAIGGAAASASAGGKARIVVPGRSVGSSPLVPRASQQQRVVMMSGTMLSTRKDSPAAREASESDSDDDPWTANVGADTGDRWSVKKRASV